MTEIGYPFQAQDLTMNEDVYLAEDVDAVLEEKDKRIAGLEDEIRFMRRTLSKYIEGKS
jgi:hypothetical protein